MGSLHVVYPHSSVTRSIRDVSYPFFTVVADLNKTTMQIRGDILARAALKRNVFADVSGAMLETRCFASRTGREGKVLAVFLVF